MKKSIMIFVVALLVIATLSIVTAARPHETVRVFLKFDGTPDLNLA